MPRSCVNWRATERGNARAGPADSGQKVTSTAAAGKRSAPHPSSCSFLQPASYGAIALLNIGVGQKRFRVARVHDLALIHHVGSIGELQRAFDVLLDQQN